LFGETLEAGVDDRGAVDVAVEVEAHRLELGANLGHGQRVAGGLQDDPAGVGGSQRDIRDRAAQPAERPDGLRQLGNAFVEVVTLGEERFVFAKRGIKGAAVMRRSGVGRGGHTVVYTLCVNRRQ
jgi:hypothetical protein